MSASVLLTLRLLLVIALYLFLTGALYLLWADLRRQSRAFRTPEIPPIQLNQTDGEREQVFRFSEQEVTIGRDPACEVHLEDKAISARHTRLVFHHGQWWVEDLKSKNGTFLNQQPVDEPMVVTSGDILRCGNIHFNLTLSGRAID